MILGSTWGLREGTVTTCGFGACGELFFSSFLLLSSLLSREYLLEEGLLFGAAGLVMMVGRPFFSKLKSWSSPSDEIMAESRSIFFSSRRAAFPPKGSPQMPPNLIKPEEMVDSGPKRGPEVFF